MEKTKIQLSTDELELMRNSAWILTKNSIIEKVSLAFKEFAIGMRGQLLLQAEGSYAEILSSDFKISKGEKYNGLPYVMLDYPRVFRKDDILAIRTMFWWGKYFSITLHAKGRYLAGAERTLSLALPVLQQNDFLISTGGDEWNHDVNHGDYVPASALNADGLKTLSAMSTFLKLSKKVELNGIEEVEDVLIGAFETLIVFLKA